jgi:hypothetical protein
MDPVVVVPAHRELYSLGYIDRVDPTLIASQLVNLAAQMGSGKLRRWTGGLWGPRREGEGDAGKNKTEQKMQFLVCSYWV